MKFKSLITILMMLLVLAWPLRQAATQQSGNDRDQTVRPPAAAERRVALVIGNGAYADRPLGNPVNDANGLAAALRELGFEVLSDTDQDLAGMQRLIRTFGQRLRGASAGLFFFAGHGVRVGSDNYLIPIGHEIESEADVALSAISAYSVLAQMEAAGAPVNLLILDACRDNPFRSFGAFNRQQSDRGLVPMRVGASGTLIVYATKPGETAADGRGRPNSPFTTSLLQHIRTPGLRIEDLFKQVVLSVEDLTNRKQSPWVEGLLRGDFYFIKPAPEPLNNTPLNPLPVYSGEQAYWRAIEDSTDGRYFCEYMKQHPNGIYVAAARAKLQRLNISCDASPPPKPTPTPTPAIAYAKVGGPAVRLVAMPFTTATVDARGTVTKLPGRSVDGFVEELGNGVRLEMVELNSGSFGMGSTEAEIDAVVADYKRYNSRATREAFTHEAPRHQVTVPGFYMGRYEVTQAQWKAVMGGLPDVGFKGDDLPVERVSWNEAVEFCKKLTAKTGREYRLPTEAEWEYAARAGQPTPFAFGPTITPDIVNYNGEYPYGAAAKGANLQKTVPVGSLGVANAWGLFDLHGNVWEWCEDIWHESYQGAPTNGSAWLGGRDSSRRVLRGGSWNGNGRYCRAAGRSRVGPGVRNLNLGLRVVISARTRP
jgi:formylglycine-generating enzyme required for sulfatase activity